MGVFDPIIELSRGLWETLTLLPVREARNLSNIPKRSGRCVRDSAAVMN
jgi:hypothetical protein